MSNHAVDRHHLTRTSHRGGPPYHLYGFNFFVPCGATTSLHSSSLSDGIHHHPFLFIDVLLGKLISIIIKVSLYISFQKRPDDSVQISHLSYYSSSLSTPAISFLMRIGITIALVMAPMEDHMIMAQIVNLLSLLWTPLISHPHYQTDIHILTDSLDIRLEDIHKFPIQINIPLLLPRQECIPR